MVEAQFPTYSRRNLIWTAAKSEQLAIVREDIDAGYADTAIIRTFELTEAPIAALKDAGFTFGSGTIPPYDEMVYLSGNSNQKRQEIFESDSWVWGRTVKIPRLEIYFKLFISEARRGIVAKPMVWGNYSDGACHRPTVDKLIATIVSFCSELDQEIHRLFRETDLNSNPPVYPVIQWAKIYMPGIRSIDALFRELYEANGLVARLADSNISPFNPNPRQRGREYFIIKSDQPRLFDQWRRQLREFKDGLR